MPMDVFFCKSCNEVVALGHDCARLKAIDKPKQTCEGCLWRGDADCPKMNRINNTRCRQFTRK